MKNLYRNLGIGLGVATLTFIPFIHATLAQDETTPATKQVEEKQPTVNETEVEHLKRAAAQKEAVEEKTPTKQADENSNASVASPPSKSDNKKDPTAKLKAKSNMLSAQADLRAKKLAAELADLKDEAERLKMQATVAKQRQENELLKMELEKQRLTAETSLEKARREKAQADMKAEIEELTAIMQLREARGKRELAELKSQTARMTTQRQLDKARNSQKNADLEDLRDKLMLEIAIKNAEFQKQTVDSKIKTNAMRTKLTIAQNELSLKGIDERQKMRLDGEIDYRKKPYDKEEKTLHITDRRIKLNGPIITGTADYVCERIHFFNNEAKDQPIFLVIDNCPGGSVMQGYRIVKAIDSSTAPVHVVVKSFAASMAAIITTLADHSYAYPNAIIMHHQMSAGAYGNMTDIEEQLKKLKEWERRLAEPLADKMGITVVQLKERMYKNNKRGNWDEFADEAVKLKWVNNIVNEIREEGTRKRPQGDPPQPWWYRFFFQDDKGNTYCKLPPLEPMDAYMIYNPNNFYRMD